jgi:hypothetical protein
MLLLSSITYCLLHNYRTASSNSSKYVKRIVHADIHSTDFEGKCISDGSKLEERNRDTLIKFRPCNRDLVTEARALEMLIALERNNRNLLNWLTPLDIMTNSNNCIQNKHDSCDGIVKTAIDGLDNTKMCTCQCHNSSYQMVQKMFGVINQKD